MMVISFIKKLLSLIFMPMQYICKITKKIIFKPIYIVFRKINIILKKYVVKLKKNIKKGKN